MTNKISPLIASQISDYLQESTPLFVAFLETYYRYLEQRQNSMGIVLNRNLDSDIDNTLDDYIGEFYKIYGEYLPSSIAMDRRNLIKLLNSVYEAKGTEKALKLIFQALFNERITISYPSDQILQASGGEWNRESFISLRTYYGNIPVGTPTLSVPTESGEYLIIVNKIEMMSVDTARFYFNTYLNINLSDNQLIHQYDDNGVLLYSGELIKSEANLVISKPGKYWQVGQVIIIPGSTKNTVCRVTKTDSFGGIVSTEILEYGFVHENNQVITISPYKNKPVGSVIDVITEIVSYDPIVYHNTINIVDHIDGVTENIVGVSDGYSINSYFLENYVSSGYTGNIVLTESSALIGINDSPISVGLSIGDWLISRATFQYEYKNIVNMRGSYKNDRCLISNQESKLQDNYFYQAFSYLIETTKDIRDYKNVLNITHPSGTKLFANIAKKAEFELLFSSDSSKSQDTVRLLEVIDTADTTSYNLTKPLYSYLSSPTEEIKYKVFGKVLSSASTPVDAINSKLFQKLLQDTTTSDDNAIKVIGKILTESVIGVDSVLSRSLNKQIDDAVTSTDNDVITFNKYIASSVNVISNDVASVSIIYYSTLDYFAENYVQNEIQLNIG